MQSPFCSWMYHQALNRLTYMTRIYHVHNYNKDCVLDRLFPRQSIKIKWIAILSNNHSCCSAMCSTSVLLWNSLCFAVSSFPILSKFTNYFLCKKKDEVMNCILYYECKRVAHFECCFKCQGLVNLWVMGIYLRDLFIIINSFSDLWRLMLPAAFP